MAFFAIQIQLLAIAAWVWVDKKTTSQFWIGKVVIPIIAVCNVKQEAILSSDFLVDFSSFVTVKRNPSTFLIIRLARICSPFDITP